MFTLEAKKRDEKESLTKLRHSGFVPAVFYGKKEKSTRIAVDKIAFKKIWKDAGESSIISLNTPDGKIDSLLYEVQVDAVTGEPLHADFYTVDKDTVIHANIPLEFTGESPAVKGGAILVKVVHELEVKSLPKDLPHNIVIDISSLVDINSQITVADIKLPSGVTTTAGPEEVIVLINAAKEEKEEEPVQPIDMSAIEVEKKGKKEEEGEAEATEDKE